MTDCVVHYQFSLVIQFLHVFNVVCSEQHRSSGNPWGLGRAPNLKHQQPAFRNYHDFLYLCRTEALDLLSMTCLLLL